MIPYRDDNPQFLTPVVTIGLIVANLAAWIVAQGAGEPTVLTRSVCELG
jgi:membrane associated rhomboid family serine protease